MLFVFPVVYWWPALVSGPFAHLGHKTTDIDGDFQFAWLLRESASLFGPQHLTNAPFGESLWRWQSFTHLLPTVVIWLAGFVTGPFLAVKLYALAGWVVSGWVVTRISHWSGVSESLSLAAGVLFQMLPWNRYIMENWVHYSWSALPLAAVWLLVSRDRRLRWTPRFSLTAAAILAISAFVDGYWMYYTAFVLLAGLLLDLCRALGRRDKVIKRRVSLILGIVTAPLALLALLSFNQTGDTTGLSRPLGVTDKSIIDTYGGDLTDLVRPDYRHAVFPRDSRLKDKGWTANPIQYAGAGLLGCSLLGSIIGIRRKRSNTITILAVTAVMLELSLRTELTGLPTLAGVVRGWTPGLQWTWRASVVAEGLMVVLAAIGLERLRTVRWSRMSVSLVLVLVVLDLNPLGGRNVVDQSRDWRPVREMLSTDGADLVLFLPSQLPTQTWMEQVFLGVPMVNGLYSQQSRDLLRKLDGEGECSLYAWMVDAGVTHLVAIRNVSVVLPGYEDIKHLDAEKMDNKMFPLISTVRIKVVGEWVSPIDVRRVNRDAIRTRCRGQ